MADTEEDGEVLSEGELEEGELLSSDEEEVSERSPAAKHAAPEPAKPPKVDKSPRAAKRPAAEPEAAGAAALKKPRLEPELQPKSELDPDGAKEIFSDDEEAAYYPQLVKSRSSTEDKKPTSQPPPETTKSSPEGGQREKYWQGSPQSSQEGSESGGGYGSGSGAEQRGSRGKRKSTDREDLFYEDRKGKSERSDEKERVDRKRDYSHHSRSDHYSSPRRGSRRDTFDKDRDRDRDGKGGVSYRDQHGSRRDSYGKDRDHSRSGDEDGSSTRDKLGGRRDRDSHSRDRNQTASSDEGGASSSYRNRDQYGYQKGGRRGQFNKQSQSQSPRQQQQQQRYWDQSQSRSESGYVAPGQMNTGMTAQQFHSLVAKVVQRRERGLSLLPTPRNISACNNLDQFNYPAPPSWYLEAVEEWEQEKAKQTKGAVMEDDREEGEGGKEDGGSSSQDKAVDIEGEGAPGVEQGDAGKKDGSETTVAEGVSGDVAAVGVVSEVPIATTPTTTTTTPVSSEMDVDTSSDRNVSEIGNPAEVKTVSQVVDSSDSVISKTGDETKSDSRGTEMETVPTGAVPALAAEDGRRDAVGERPKETSETPRATAVAGISSASASKGATSMKQLLGLPSEKTPESKPVTSRAAHEDNQSELEVDDFDYDQYLDQLDEEEEEVEPEQMDFLLNPLSEDFPRVGPADESSSKASRSKSAGPSLKSLVKQEIDLTVVSDEAKDAPPPPAKSSTKRPNKSAHRLQKEAAWRAQQQEREAAAAKKLEEATRARQKLPCRYFMSGFCKHGVNCSYSHVTAPREKKKEICKFFLLNNCSKGEECAYYHGKFPCKFFHTKSCNFGDQCKFSHDPLTPETHELLMAVLEPPRDPSKLPVVQAFPGSISSPSNLPSPGGMQAYPGSIPGPSNLLSPGGMQPYPGSSMQGQIEPSGAHMQVSPTEGVRMNFGGFRGSVMATDLGESQNEPVARQQQPWGTQSEPPRKTEEGLVVSIPKLLSPESLIVSVPRSKLTGRFHSGFTAMPVAVVSVATTQQQHPAATTVTVQSFVGPPPLNAPPPFGFPPVPPNLNFPVPIPNPPTAAAANLMPAQLSSQPIPLFPPKPRPPEVDLASSLEPPRRALLPTPPPHMKLAPDDIKRMELAQPEYWESPDLQGPQVPAPPPFPAHPQQGFYPQNGAGPVANNAWSTPSYDGGPHGIGPRPQRQGGMDLRPGNTTDLRQEGMAPRHTDTEMGHGGFDPRPGGGFDPRQGGFDPRQGQADLRQMPIPPRPPPPLSQPGFAQPPPPPLPPIRQQQQLQWMGPGSVPHHPPQLPPPQRPTLTPFHPRPDSHIPTPGSSLPAPFGSLPQAPLEKTSPVWGLGSSPEHTGSTGFAESSPLSSPSGDPRRVNPRTKYAHLKIKPKGQSASPQQQQPGSTSSILKKSASSKQSESSERLEPKQETPFKIPKLLQNPLVLDNPLDPKELFGSNAKGLETEQDYGEITAPFGSFRPFFSRNESGRRAGPSSSQHGTGTKQPYGEITLEHQDNSRRKSVSPPPVIARTAPPEAEKEEKETKLSPSENTVPAVPSYLASLGLGGGSDDLTIDSAFGSLGDKSKVATETGKEPEKQDTAKKLPSIFGLGFQ